MDGKDRFAEVGVGEEAAYFSFVPEFEVELFWGGACRGIGDGLIGCLDAEDADSDGLPAMMICFQYGDPMERR